MPVSVRCAHCGATINKFPSQVRERNFCDKWCQGAYRSEHYVGEKAAHWQGGVRRDRSRVMIYCPDHPNASNKGYVYRYRLVIEKELGRPLTNDEIVHHLDGDETNDDPSNLVAMTQSDHIRLHRPRLGVRSHA